MNKRKFPISASYFYSEYLKSKISEGDRYRKRYSAYRHITEQLGVKGGENLGINSFRYLPFTESFYHKMRKNLSQKNSNEILKEYSGLKKKEIQHPGLLHLVASAYYLSSDLDNALKLYQDCLGLQDKFRKPYYSKKHDYQTILDQCQLGEARVFYEQREFEKAYESYLKISSNSIYYPESFIEKAWTHYQLERFDRVLGHAMAFKSPKLLPYYDGEVEILASLAFANSCHWDNAFSMFNNIRSNVDQYIQANIKVKKRVKKFVTEYINSGEVAKDLEETLVQKHFKTPFWITNRNIIIKAEEELVRLDSENPYYQDLKLFIEKLIAERTRGLQVYLLSKLDGYTRKLNKLKIKSDTIEMEVLARMRKQLYTGDLKAESLVLAKDTKTFQPNFNYNWSRGKQVFNNRFNSLSISIEDKCSNRKVANEKK